MGFEGLLDYQSVLNAVKTVLPDIQPLKWHSMAYNQLACQLMLYLKMEDTKTVLFKFAVSN